MAFTRTAFATLKLLIAIVLFFVCAPIHAQDVRDDVEWCLKDDTNWSLAKQAGGTIDYQTGGHPYCKALYAGQIFFSGFSIGDALGGASTGVQHDWARGAVLLACTSLDRLTPVGLIAACQCHDDSAFMRVLKNPGPVLDELEKHCSQIPNIEPIDIGHGGGGGQTTSGHFGAIAIDLESGIAGIAVDKNSMDQAKADASTSCGGETGCLIVETMIGQGVCGAVASGGSIGWDASVGTTHRATEAAAIAECNRHPNATGCSSWMTGCNSGTPGGPFGAIAINPSTGSSGSARNFTSADEADSTAISKCGGPGCKVVTEFAGPGRCASVASGGTNGWNAYTDFGHFVFNDGPQMHGHDSIERIAIAQCRLRDPNNSCHPWMTSCND